MRSSEQQAAFEAVKRMDPQLVMMNQIAVLQCAVRALIVNSPNAAQIRTNFDQLFAQAQAFPGFITSQDQSVVLRDLVETTFRAAVPPET